MMPSLKSISKNWKRFIDWALPMCPNGGHRQRGELVKNINDNTFCWHSDCIKANFKDVELTVDCLRDCLPTCTCAATRSPVPCSKAMGQ